MPHENRTDLICFPLQIATLVSQLAKGSELLALTTPIPPPARPATPALALAALATSPLRAFTRANSALTLGFTAAVAAVYAGGVPRADWSRLAAADWSAALASAPTLLQLHVYAEVTYVLPRDLLS